MGEAIQAPSGRDDDIIVGVRFAPGGPLVFCMGGDPGLGRGRRVLVADGAGEREGVVALEPALVIAAPALPDAPRITAVLPEEAARITAISPDEVAHIAAVLPDEAARRDAPAPLGEAAFLPVGEDTVGEVAFLPAGEGAIGPADLALALRLAALPVPHPPEPRR